MSMGVRVALRRVRVSAVQLLPPHWWGRVIFCVLLGGGIFLRVAGLDWGIPRIENAASYYHDEGHVLAMVLADHATYVRTFGEYEVVRPVYFFRVVGRPLIELGTRLKLNDPGNRVFEFAVLRSLVAAFGIAGLVGAYLLGRRLLADAAGLWALAFLTVMPGHWFYSQILKGDLLVATMLSFLALAALRIMERGDLRSYSTAGILLGVGTALKVTTVVGLPLLLAAHLLRAWRSPSRLRALFPAKAAIAMALGLLGFLALYPYPFWDRDRLVTLLTEPQSQDLAPSFDIRPAVYARLWKANVVDVPFLDMVVGRFFTVALLPILAWTAGSAINRWRRRGDGRLLLLIIFFAVFIHTLTFSPPLDERYLLPGVPFVAVFAGLVVGGLGASSRSVGRRVGYALGGVLFFGTLAITATYFPMHGLLDPREETVAWVSSRAPAGALIGQPTIQSRWSLVVDSTRTEQTALIIEADGERRIARHARPDLVLVQREPWHWEHNFRYELLGPLRAAFDDFLRAYERVAVFGREPELLGHRLPRGIGSPVIDAYERRGDPREETTSLLTVPLPPFELQGTTVRVLEHPLSADDLRGAFVRVRFDLRGLREVWGTPAGLLRLGILVLEDGSLPPEQFADLSEESALLTTGGVFGWLTSFRPASEVRPHDSLSVLLDRPHGTFWDVYDGFDGALRPRATGSRTFSTVRLALVVMGPETSAGSIRVTEVSLGRLASTP